MYSLVPCHSMETFLKTFMKMEWERKAWRVQNMNPWYAVHRLTPLQGNEIGLKEDWRYVFVLQLSSFSLVISLSQKNGDFVNKMYLSLTLFMVYATSFLAWFAILNKCLFFNMCLKVVWYCMIPKVCVKLNMKNFQKVLHDLLQHNIAAWFIYKSRLFSACQSHVRYLRNLCV